MVIWCAPRTEKQTMIVGWYEHATVYRWYQKSILTPMTGTDRDYFAVANARDCYLLPEENRTFVIFLPHANVKKLLSEIERKKFKEAAQNDDYLKMLPFLYNDFEETHSADTAHDIAFSLKELFLFKESLKWYHKVIELEGASWEINFQMPYLYSQCNQFEKTINEAKCLLKYQEAKKRLDG